jgi:hypothetical protein
MGATKQGVNGRGSNVSRSYNSIRVCQANDKPSGRSPGPGRERGFSYFVASAWPVTLAGEKNELR